jgi:hypothetical protein
MARGVLNFAAAALPGRSSIRGGLVPVEMISCALGVIMLQTGTYIFRGMALALMLGVTVGRSANMHDLFLAGAHTPNDLTAVGFAHVAAYGPQLLIIGLVVQHVSQVADHVVTFILLHFVLQWRLTGLPGTAWWVLAVIDGVVLTLLGEVACARRDSIRLATVSQDMERPGTVASRGGGSQPASAGAPSANALRPKPAMRAGGDSVASPLPPLARTPESEALKTQ